MWSISLRERFIHFCFGINAKCVIGFVTQMSDRSQTSTGLSQVDYLECLHCQQPFCKQNKFCNVPLNTFCKEWKKKATLGHWKVIYKWYATQAQKFSNYKCMHTKIFDNSSILFFVICLYNPEQPPKTLQSLFVCSNW